MSCHSEVHGPRSKVSDIKVRPGHKTENFASKWKREISEEKVLSCATILASCSGLWQDFGFWSCSSHFSWTPLHHSSWIINSTWLEVDPLKLTGDLRSALHIPLQIILGDVNVSILNRNDKVRYKDDYEKFKLILNVIGLIMAFFNLIFNYRWVALSGTPMSCAHSQLMLPRALELAFIFLLVWYYCTLTIRESILKVNGSRIKGWWRAHHFISTVAAGVLLVWPQGEHWQIFRMQFMYFNVYISELCFSAWGILYASTAPWIFR